MGSQISERFLNQNEINEIVNHPVNDGKFKIKKRNKYLAKYAFWLLFKERFFYKPIK